MHWGVAFDENLVFFDPSSGVRQGCPLTPFLSILCVIILLQHLRNELPDAVVRAFPDDTAMMCIDFRKHSAQILHVYSDFALVSNLRLNLDKTVLIPLWPCVPDQVKRTLINSDCPQ